MRIAKAIRNQSISIDKQSVEVAKMRTAREGKIMSFDAMGEMFVKGCKDGIIKNTTFEQFLSMNETFHNCKYI